jgi:hypothetical protein
VVPLVPATLSEPAALASEPALLPLGADVKGALPPAPALLAAGVSGAFADPGSLLQAAKNKAKTSAKRALIVMRSEWSERRETAQGKAVLQKRRFSNRFLITSITSARSRCGT